MKRFLIFITLVVALAAAPWGPAYAEKSARVLDPGLDPGQCYTFPQIPGHVTSTICRYPYAGK